MIPDNSVNSFGPSSPLIVVTLLVIWLLVAVLAGGFGLLRGAGPGLIAAVVWGLVGITMLAISLSGRLMRSFWAVPLVAVVMLHGFRAPIGVAFFVEEAAGRLPQTWAIPAAIGDVVVGASAVAVTLTCIPPASLRRRRVLYAWNLFGLLDILLVVANGIRHARADPQSMARLTELPFSLLPTFFVPIVITTHILLYLRVRRIRI